MPIDYRASKWLARLAVAFGGAEFALRALGRTHSNWLCDFAPPYISTRLWLEGSNPYDSAKSIAAWYAGGAPHLAEGVSTVAYSVYPPPTLLLLVPLALLRWHYAFYAFMALGLLLYAAVIFGLVRLGWPQHKTLSSLFQDPTAMLFVAFALGFAPVHTAFHSVNIVLFACCAAILAVVASSRAGLPKSSGRHEAASRTVPVGFLIGVGVSAAILLKPTSGIFLLPWLVRERRWRWLASIVLACSIVTGASLALLLARQGVSWLPDYRQNVAALFTHGGDADVSPANLDNTDRIDLQLVAFAATNNRTIASGIAALTYGCLLLAFFRRTGWGRGSERAKASHWLNMPLLAASGSLAIGLIPSYSRVYAAIVLLPLVFWCFGHLRFSSARWLLLLLSDFLLNTSAIVKVFGAGSEVLAHVPRLWDFTIGGHTCWLLLAIGCLLVKAAAQQSQEDASMAAGVRFESAMLDPVH